MLPKGNFVELKCTTCTLSFCYGNRRFMFQVFPFKLLLVQEYRSKGQKSCTHRTVWLCTWGFLHKVYYISFNRFYILLMRLYAIQVHLCQTWNYHNLNKSVTIFVIHTIHFLRFHIPNKIKEVIKHFILGANSNICFITKVPSSGSSLTTKDCKSNTYFKC